MSLEGAIYSRLTTTAGVTALVSTRVYPIELPERPTYPAATYQRVGGRSVQSHQLPKTGTSAFASVQITAFAETRRAAHTVLAAIRAAIEAVTWTADGTLIYSCWMVDEFDIERESGARIEGVGQIYDIMHS